MGLFSKLFGNNASVAHLFKNGAANPVTSFSKYTK